MHGLADHGTAHHGVSIAAAAESGASSLDLGTQADEPAGHQAPLQEDGNLGLIGLCLAVLALGLVLTAAWLLFVRATSRQQVLPTFSVTGLLARARDPVAPSPWMLSIQRC